MLRQGLKPLLGHARARWIGELTNMSTLRISLSSLVVLSGLATVSTALAQDAVPTAEEAPTPAAEPVATAPAVEPPAEVTPAEASAEAPPAEAPAEVPAAEAAPADEGGDMSLTLDLGVGSAYVWRGANLWFGLADNKKQALSVFPGVTFAAGDLSVFYWGAYQLSGDTKGANADNGIGAEQDLGLSYALSLNDEMGVSLWATYYVYPFADTDALDGTPMYLEPGATLSYSSAVNLGLGVSYYKALTLTDANDVLSHIYLNPSVGKDLELSPELALNLSAGFGYKVFTSSDYDAEVTGNRWDVIGNVGLTYSVGDLYLKPAVHVGTTEVPESIDESGLFYWGGLNVGYGIGL